MLSSAAKVTSQTGLKRPSVSPAQSVRAARLRANLTQEDLALRAGKHVNTIANIEDEDGPVRLTIRGWRTVEDVAQALDTTPEALGFRLRRRVDPRMLTSEQREIIEDILALPKNDLAAVRQMLRTIEARKGRGKGK